ncbi:ALG3 [[Candida] subhashii]|uniref:Dol-P-Man:Man(5)GlcNAc(2)-PP-Dol alpha-1,3-mannosyltransferase n=1 Tax=[Candida] subhashii TaxID=561895 RepID=A0A8J5R755_9ASCO|nr:ALG3 [[Candida] subhashii]KAG7666070.1 ALG3 [[Candida] subhashii]
MAPNIKGQAIDRPKLTFRNVLKDIKEGTVALVVNPNATRIVIPLVVCLASILTKVIIAKIPYTEIDFKTYMQQIELINDGEILYEDIYGDTGPIVYPAGFVHIYQWIYWLANNGEDIPTVQQAFGYLFVITLILVIASYSMCNDIPPWCYYLLLLSKRLFSIYVLRLFNDCWTTACMVGVVVILQQASYWYKTSELASFLLCLVAGDLKVAGKSLYHLIKDGFNYKNTISKTNMFINPNMGPQLILLVMSTTNVIGVLFSRSLHYQFLSWYAWQLPFLLFSMGINVYFGVLIWFAHEWCWNVFPSTKQSSGALIAILSIVLVGVWVQFLKFSPAKEEDKIKKTQ